MLVARPYAAALLVRFRFSYRGGYFPAMSVASLLKRVKVTAKGKVKFMKAFRGHLRSHKSGNELMKLRGKNIAKAADMNRLEAMLHRKLTPKGRD